MAWDEIGLAPASKALVRDLWKKVDAGMRTGRFQAKVDAHDVVVVRITPQF